MDYEEELRRSPERVVKEAENLYETGGRLKKTWDRLARRLSELGITAALVGGYALILHGVRRFTEDIDVLVTGEDLRTLSDSLVGNGYAGVQGNARAIRDAETGVRIDFVVSGQFPGDGNPKPVAFPAPGGFSKEVNGIRVVDLKTLIELKLASGMTGKGRLQDLADVQRLIQAHELTETYAEGLHPYVRAKFLELLKSVS